MLPGQNTDVERAFLPDRIFGEEIFDRLQLPRKLIEERLAEATMFTADGESVIPSEMLYKKPVLVERGSFRPLTNPMLEMLERSHEQFLKEPALAGFHDPSGDAAQNAELAKQRAQSVRNALVAGGVATDRIKFRKPESTVGTGSPEEGRRVEIRVQ